MLVIRNPAIVTMTDSCQNHTVSFTYIKHMSKKILESPIKTACLIFCCATIPVVLISGYWEVVSSTIFPNTSWGLYNKDFWENILVEAHGMLLDIFVIGIIVLWFDKFREKKSQNNSFLERIDDFRYWHSDEAIHRVIGILRRLNENDISKFNLSNYKFSASRLKNINFKGSNLMGINFENTNLRNCDLAKANLTGANLNKSSMKNCSLEKAVLQRANFTEAILKGINLQKTDLKRTLFQGANLQSADFRKSNMENTNLLDANLRSANLKQVENLTAEQLFEAKTLKDIKIDADLLDRIKLVRPDLLEIKEEEEAGGIEPPSITK